MSLRFQVVRKSDAQIFKSMHPLMAEWFKKRFSTFTEPQRGAILDIHAKQNVLISAPTGTGKTLSAFSAILNELVVQADRGVLEDRVYCVYVSPLKALNNDIEKNLREPLQDIVAMAAQKNKAWDIRVSVRTGDTSALEKSKMLKKPPHILITTPETLSILLSTEKFVDHLKRVQWVIIDEIHSLAGNKRGAHLALSLERLESYSPNFTRVGLSATVAPLTEVARFLVGMKNARQSRNCLIVDVPIQKKLDLGLLCPVPDLMNASPQNIQTELFSLLSQLVEGHQTTLIFTNTRAATERVVHQLRTRFPTVFTKDNIEAHHSAVSREHRLDVENRLKKGELKCVVTSTSLELGIDIGFIDLVVLLGSPKSVANTLQRIGRAGHRLHDTVKGRFVVLDRDDLVECALLQKNARENKINQIQVVENSLDVLAQQVFGHAVNVPATRDELFATVTKSYPFRRLLRADFEEVVDYLSGKFQALEKHYVFAKLFEDPETGVLSKRGKMSRVLFMTNAGTIAEEAKIKVKHNMAPLGTIDESFVERLQPGDVFILGGKTYRFKFTRGNTCQVEPAEKSTPTVPHWVSEALPLSYELAVSVQEFREKASALFEKNESGDVITQFIQKETGVDAEAAASMFHYLEDQHRYLGLPHRHRIFIEFFEHGFEMHAVVHALFGRRINEVLARSLAAALSHVTRFSVRATVSDHGFMLSGQSLPLFEALAEVSKKSLERYALESIGESELFVRRFRHCASRSLMILRWYKGRSKSVGRQQMNARLLLHTCQKISPDFFILRETRREIFSQMLDLARARKVWDEIESGKIEMREAKTDSPSPFALGLFAQSQSDVRGAGEKSDLVRQLHDKIQQKLNTRIHAVSYY